MKVRIVLTAEVEDCEAVKKFIPLIFTVVEVEEIKEETYRYDNLPENMSWMKHYLKGR